ncbi:hypothetical protein M407DRAFT_28282 [Tulasnella calospora MUT 4182]|uniref:Uncharacterized protein n=1 Tax=Tulasnella calospora MUT 4182 TaxID=1051891 RepID=A0A0C3QCC5_9AGAM|nr:hypothetical protein M407DRAFT_28282 [Tulasnella calospora MUT 4182]
MSVLGAPTGPGAFDPQTGANCDYAQAAERAIDASSVYNHLPAVLAVPAYPVSSASPNLFTNTQYFQQVARISFLSTLHNLPAYPHRQLPQTPDTDIPSNRSSPRPSAMALLNTSPVSTSSALKTEPADAP